MVRCDSKFFCGLGSKFRWDKEEEENQGAVNSFSLLKTFPM